MLHLFRFGLIALAAAIMPAVCMAATAATPPVVPPVAPFATPPADAMAPRAAWAKCGNCRERVEWDRHIAGYQLVMLSAVTDGSQDRVAARDGHGVPAADRTAILRQRFELRRGGQIMLDIEDRWLDPAHDVDLRLPPPGTDVAGTGQPQVVLLGWSGEGSCCFTLHIIELGPEPRILAQVAARDGVPRLVQHDADPDFEIVVEDATYAGWSMVSPPALPRVVLKYDPQAGHYRFAAAEMRRPPPPISRLEAEAKLLQEGAAKAPDDGRVPPHLLRTMLRLIYAGNYPLARRFLDDAWNDRYGVKREAFLKDLMECRLPRSPYWVDIATMNGLTPVAPRADCAGAAD
ncbi:hypothetical protein [Ferrovibrio xuzhouensis]|uniref:YARHG domain-containing protein n=1 Tax=Ferrovibrio xuzhouensis TaxID=1576914 RepID=A0ABV7VE74_9PROT